MSDPEVVTISKKEYEELLKDQEFLRALEQAGVDNWDGYSYAYEILEDNQKDGQAVE